MAKISSRQIEAFRAVMMTGSITAAAEFMRITQPAVSRLIQDLEAISGLKCFERRANHLVPTGEALTLAAEVERSFVGIARIEEFIRAMRSQQSGSLRIAAMPALATEVLPRFIGEFIGRRPSVHVSIDGHNSLLVAEAVASGSIDFGFVAAPIDRPGFEVELLGGNAVVAMHENHPLAAKRVIVPADLVGQTLAGSYQNLFQARIDIALAGVDCERRIETRLAHVACVFAAQGQSVAFVDPYMVGIFAERGLVGRPFEPNIPCDYSLLISRKRPQSPLAVSFLAEFRAYMDRLRNDALRQPRSDHAAARP